MAQQGYRIQVCIECGAPAVVNWRAKIWAPTCGCQEACGCASSLLVEVEILANLDEVLTHIRTTRAAALAGVDPPLPPA